ncbi:MAG: hypothetical protein M1819_002375 [Sarea resinae]|nr:MAG: hypothetical protein M1819_002375 [Sarea resinae]
MENEPVSTEEAPVTFNVKSSSDAKYVLTLPLTTTVGDLKSKLSTSEYADIPAERQRLIYSGRVLKDNDTLGNCKIKDGNTVHLVKGAASNQRQNPANQGGAASTAAPGTPSSGAAGVPTNLAAGTGNNPLAGLTGARYAGHVQLPGAGMFGPDGGMGPPPAPEDMLRALENPMFASTMNEALQNPELIDMMIQQNPMLRSIPGVRQMMSSPEFRRMMTDPDTIRQMSQMRQSMGGMGGSGGQDSFPMPGVTDTTPGQTREGGGSTGTPNQANPFAMGMGPNPFAALFPHGQAGTPRASPPATSTGQATPAQAGTPGAPEGTNPPPNPFASFLPPQSQDPNNAQAPPQNPFSNPLVSSMLQNPEAMRNMMQMLGGGPGNPDPNNPQQGQQQSPLGNPFSSLLSNPEAMQNMMQMMGGGGVGGNPFGFPAAGSPPPAPADTRPPEERYESQLRQLNDMGFYEFERNVEALRRSGGSVQGAVEYLLTH